MASLATLVSLLLVQALLGGSATTTTTASPPWSSTADAYPKWTCPEVSVQANLTVKQVVGDWFVLELDGTPQATAKDVCYKLSLTDVREESANSSSVVVTIYSQRSDASKAINYRFGSFFLTHAAQEFVKADLNSVWRLHSLSADGHVLVMATCNVRRLSEVYWITLGVAHDSLPAGWPPRSANSVRRDDNFCREIADTGDTTPSSN